MSLGIGMSGFLVAIISFVTIWWVPPADRSGSHVKTPAEAAPEAFLYFALSSITIAAAIVTYFVFFRMKYVRAHRQPQGACSRCEFHNSCCSYSASWSIHACSAGRRLQCLTTRCASVSCVRPSLMHCCLAVLAEWEWHSEGAEPVAKEARSTSAAGSSGSEGSDLERPLLLSQAPSPVKAAAPLPASTGAAL